MIILVEGPDCSGKTTYANWLRTEHGYDVIHYGSFDSNPIANYLELLNSLDPNDNVVIDRCWLSELIYGRVLRGGHRLIDGQYRMLQRAFIHLQGCMVLVSTPKSVVESRLGNSKRIEMDGVRDHWEDLYKEYEIYNPGVPFVKYAGVPHSSMPEPIILSEQVDNFYFYSGIRGRKDARVLFLTVDPHANSGLRFPYCSTTGFGLWFNKMMSSLNIPEMDISWGHVPGGVSVRSINEMNPSIIVSMSKGSDTWYNENMIDQGGQWDYIHVKSPEYWYSRKWNKKFNSPYYPAISEINHLYRSI